MVLGHEAAGVVAKLGSSVSNLKVGSKLIHYIFTICLYQGGRPCGYRARSTLCRLRLLQDGGKRLVTE